VAFSGAHLFSDPCDVLSVPLSALLFVFVAIRTFAGDPASSPRNSPICHCRVSIQTGSRTLAASVSLTEPGERGRGSSRFQKVMDPRELHDSSVFFLDSSLRLIASCRVTARVPPVTAPPAAQP